MIFKASAIGHLLAISLAICSHDHPRVNADSFDFDTAVMAAMNDLSIRGAGVVFMAPGLDEPIRRGFGKVSASNDSDNVTADTAFQLASISKVFVGAAVAVLVDQGIISSLEDDICNVIPTDYNMSACVNPYYPDDVITWRMMLTHRSTLTSSAAGSVVDIATGKNVTAMYAPTGGYAPEERAAGNPTCPLDDVQGFYRDIMIDKESETKVGRVGLEVEGGGPLNWYDIAQLDLDGVWESIDRPGSYHDYSNFAYGYLTALVEYATGQSFEEFSQENIFSKLGMSRTSWFRETLPNDTVTAMPNYLDEDGSWIDVGYYCYIDYGSGQLHTTANDMALWGDAMLKKGAPTLWSNDTAAQHVFGCQEQDETGALLGSDGNVTACSHALAWFLLDNDKKEAWMENILDSDDPYYTMLAPFLELDWTNGVLHDGSEFGVQTQLIVFPDAGVYIAAMTSTSDNDDSAAQILTQVVGQAGMKMIEDLRGDLENVTSVAKSNP